MSIGTIYFNWLYNQVVGVWDVNSPVSYIGVCTHLHAIEFDDRVPNDDNRRKEGEELRDEFIAAHSEIIEIEEYTELVGLGRASLFEMLIALARRADYIVEVGPRTWFKSFLDNLGLTRYNDARHRPQDDVRIERILRTFNQRTYSRTGKGGLFPLKDPKSDQRSTELWFQMAAFMRENELY
jgi:hypothetical protein